LYSHWFEFDSLRGGGGGSGPEKTPPKGRVFKARGGTVGPQPTRGLGGGLNIVANGPRAFIFFSGAHPFGPKKGGRPLRESRAGPHRNTPPGGGRGGGKRACVSGQRQQFLGIGVEGGIFEGDSLVGPWGPGDIAFGCPQNPPPKTPLRGPRPEQGGVGSPTHPPRAPHTRMGTKSRGRGGGGTLDFGPPARQGKGGSGGGEPWTQRTVSGGLFFLGRVY